MFRNLKDIKDSLKAGDKVYAVCMGKSIAMFQIGKEPLENGMNILGAHIDSPRIDVKQNPGILDKPGIFHADHTSLPYYVHIVHRLHL